MGVSFFEVRISLMLDRAQLWKEIAVFAMAIDQQLTEVGSSSVFNMLEGSRGLPVI